MLPNDEKCSVDNWTFICERHAPLIRSIQNVSSHDEAILSGRRDVFTLSSWRRRRWGGKSEEGGTGHKIFQRSKDGCMKGRVGGTRISLLIVKLIFALSFNNQKFHNLYVPFVVGGGQGLRPGQPGPREARRPGGEQLRVRRLGSRRRRRQGR